MVPGAGCGLLRLAPPRLSPALARALHGPGRPQEHSATAQYPAIPGSAGKVKFQGTKDFMQNLKTVEEKQYQINRPKYYGWYSFMLDQDWIPVGGLEFLQSATQTAVVAGLPDQLAGEEGEGDGRVDGLVQELAPLVEQTILDLALHTNHGFEVENDRVACREPGAVRWGPGAEQVLEQRRAEVMVRALHQVVCRHLARTTPHLATSSEDFSARNEAFWFRGGIGPDKSMIKKREGLRKFQQDEFQSLGKRRTAWTPHGMRQDAVDAEGNLQFPVMTEARVMEPFERALQYEGSNTVQVRCAEPLPAWVPRDHELVKGSEVPWLPHDPREWGFKAKTQNGTNVPGYWPDETNQHGLLLLTHRTNKYLTQMAASEGVITEQLVRDGNTARALLSCFGWLLPQACHLGFSPLTDLVSPEGEGRPLATQACLTDGRTWSHYAYQLNTTDLGRNSREEYTHNNLLWVGEDQVLYDRIESGRLVDYDPSVLAPLVRQYLRRPEARPHSMTPYLGECSTVSQFPDTYQRQYFMGIHRHMYSKRPRHHAKPEMYMWEKMHLIDHPGMLKAMLGLRRRRWFQMYKVDQHGKQHWHPEFKRYDETRHRHIPKWFREPWQRKKGLGRRDSKRAPKVTVPLQDKVSVYQMPDLRYNKEKPLTGYAYQNDKAQGPGFS